MLEKYEDKNHNLIGTIYRDAVMAIFCTKQHQKSLKYLQHSLMIRRKFIEIKQENDDDNNFYPNAVLLLSIIGVIYSLLENYDLSSSTFNFMLVIQWKNGTQCCISGENIKCYCTHAFRTKKLEKLQWW